jgi:hypothetical protein
MTNHRRPTRDGKPHLSLGMTLNYIIPAFCGGDRARIGALTGRGGQGHLKRGSQ